MSERPTPHPSGAWDRADYVQAYDELEAKLAERDAQIAEARTALLFVSRYDGPGFPHGTCATIAEEALARIDAKGGERE